MTTRMRVSTDLVPSCAQLQARPATDALQELWPFILRSLLARLRMTDRERSQPARCAGRLAHPHLFEIVEGANLRAEDMNDHVARIDQHPVAMRYAFDPGGNAGLVQILDDPVGDRADMALRPAGRHDHVVADRRFISQIDGEDVLGLHIVEAGEDQTKDLLGVKTHSGDRFGRATFGPRELQTVDRGPYPFAPFSGPGLESRAVRPKIGTLS